MHGQDLLLPSVGGVIKAWPGWFQKSEIMAKCHSALRGTCSNSCATYGVPVLQHPMPALPLAMHPWLTGRVACQGQGACHTQHARLQ
jgi:hypothetical protein